MTDFTKFAFAAFAICAFVSGFLALASFINIAGELNRARRAGEADNIRTVDEGLPIQVISTPNILPLVEADRRLLVWAFAAFVPSLAAALIVWSIKP